MGRMESSAGLVAPNAFERKQIELALRKRKRYRYVRPKISLVETGVLIESPCCSRRVDPDGGMVDIAMLQHAASGAWLLYWKDHVAGQWRLHSVRERLAETLETLQDDPERIFWQ